MYSAGFSSANASLRLLNRSQRAQITPLSKCSLPRSHGLRFKSNPPVLKGTKTHQNLKDAFAGESMANRRYLFFASKAGETGHAHGHLYFLEEIGDPVTNVPIGKTRDNLKSAIVGETHEYTDMYPGYAKTAKEEGLDEIADWFEVGKFEFLFSEAYLDPSHGRKKPCRKIPKGFERIGQISEYWSNKERLETRKLKMENDFEVPYYAVIFTSIRTEGENGYSQMADRMEELAKLEPGFLGMESVRDGSGLGITVSYWKDVPSFLHWKKNPEHINAQEKGRQLWYQSYKIRIAKVEREYHFIREGETGK